MTDPTVAEQVARRLLTGEETSDVFPPYRCLPPADREWLEFKIKKVAMALAEARREGVDKAINAFMQDHNTPKGRCEDDEGNVVCGCEQLADTMRRRSRAPQEPG